MAPLHPLFGLAGRSRPGGRGPAGPAGRPRGLVGVARSRRRGRWPRGRGRSVTVVVVGFVDDGGAGRLVFWRAGCRAGLRQAAEAASRLRGSRRSIHQLAAPALTAEVTPISRIATRPTCQPDGPTAASRPSPSGPPDKAASRPTTQPAAAPETNPQTGAASRTGVGMIRTVSTPAAAAGQVRHGQHGQRQPSPVRGPRQRGQHGERGQLARAPTPVGATIVPPPKAKPGPRRVGRWPRRWRSGRRRVCDEQQQQPRRRAGCQPAGQRADLAQVRGQRRARPASRPPRPAGQRAQHAHDHRARPGREQPDQPRATGPARGRRPATRDQRRAGSRSAPPGRATGRPATRRRARASAPATSA